nr:hypothetical protein Iba_chr10aCG5670 [Ipomoea batatas]
MPSLLAAIAVAPRPPISRVPSPRRRLGEREIVTASLIIGFFRLPGNPLPRKRYPITDIHRKRHRIFPGPSRKN